jgi:predicted ATPase
MNTNYFNHISIKGYRRLFSVEVQMRPLTVMIGANGVGKTAFLEVFSLLAASANGQLDSRISELGGMSEILTRSIATSLTLGLSMGVSEHERLNYTLQLDIKGGGHDIRLETLTQGDSNEPFKHIDCHGSNLSYYDTNQEQLIRPEWQPIPSETFLSQIPNMFQQQAHFRHTLASSTYYSAYALNVAPKSPIRLPQTMRPVKLPGKNGEDIVSYLYYLRETDKPRFEMVEDSLAAAFPSFERLSFPPVATGMLALTWHDKNFSAPLYMHQLSEGTLRFLWLVTLLQSSNLTAITLIDEPEVSLHPELLSLLSELMREAAERTQLIVATHSDRLIGFLEPHEVLVVDADEKGLTKKTWADDDELDLEMWLENYSLDELWRMGRMGGRS